jgi:four helix bundle protein
MDPIQEQGTFEKLEIWQEVVELAARIFETFRACKEWDFRGQVQRAAVSISSNIAEGYERDSNAEFIRFLDIARGSCGEVRSQLHLSVRVKLLPSSVATPLIDDARRLSRRIGRLMEVRRAQFK